MIEIPKPVEVKALPGYKIWLKFSDGKSGEIDLGHLRSIPVFKLWDAPCFFEKVSIVDNGRCIGWNDELELCPNTLYLELIENTYEEYAAYK